MANVGRQVGIANALRHARGGFTLIELLVVIVIFAMVLGFTYEILVSTLQAQHEVDEMTHQGKIGPSILALMRRDLQSAAFQGLGKKVFLGVDAGEGEDAEDSFHCLTFAPVPPPPEGVYDEWGSDIASVGYLLKRGDEASTLFRRVQWQINDDPYEGDGRYFPAYERVRGMSIRYFDGFEWLTEWNSESRFPEEPEEGAPPAGDGTGSAGDGNNAGGSDTGGSAAAGGSNATGGTGDTAEEEPEELLPLPRAVEITIYTYMGDERGLKKDESGNPITEKTSMIVALPVTDLLDLDEDDDDENPTGNGAAATGN